MINQLILDEKYKAQKRLNDEADNDLDKYLENCHRNVLEIKPLPVLSGNVPAGWKEAIY